MRAVVQRVRRAEVRLPEEPDEGVVGSTRPERAGLLVLLGAGEGDDERDADYLADKIVGLRVFEDEAGRMNRSLEALEGDLLVVSQFTLYGDCRKGRRPSFVHALDPEAAERLLERFVATARGRVPRVETGRFQAEMQVELVNDGPVTLLLDSSKTF